VRLRACGRGIREARYAVADLRYFDGGHFVLDEYADAIAEANIETFSPFIKSGSGTTSAERRSSGSWGSRQPQLAVVHRPYPSGGPPRY
jgi:hypothetical protein